MSERNIEIIIDPIEVTDKVKHGYVCLPLAKYEHIQSQLQQREQELTNAGLREIDYKLTIDELSDRIKVLEEAISSVEQLINSSHGVDGLRLNGDVATWEDLRSGGRFEEWLCDFDEALEDK